VSGSGSIISVVRWSLRVAESVAGFVTQSLLQCACDAECVVEYVAVRRSMTSGSGSIIFAVR